MSWFQNDGMFIVIPLQVPKHGSEILHYAFTTYYLWSLHKSSAATQLSCTSNLLFSTYFTLSNMFLVKFLASRYCTRPVYLFGDFNYVHLLPFFPSVLWQRWLGERKGIRPVKTSQHAPLFRLCITHNWHSTIKRTFQINSHIPEVWSLTVIVAIAPDSELKLLSVSTPARGHHLMMRVRE